MKRQEFKPLIDIYDREEDFSADLAKHLDLLQLGDFHSAQCEVETRNRSADIVAFGSDNSERLVIENQFGKADWDH